MTIPKSFLPEPVSYKLLPQTEKIEVLDPTKPLHELRKKVNETKDPIFMLSYVQHLGKLADEMNLNQRAKAHTEALRILKKSAIMIPEAMLLLAECYGSGMLSLAIDHEKAFVNYIKAAKGGNPVACYRAGVCLETGTGTKVDFMSAMIYYRRGCELGNVQAMYKLGLILLHNEQNPMEAITFLEKAAADNTIPHPLHELGVLFLNGYFCENEQNKSRTSSGFCLVEPNLDLSIFYFEKAGTLGYAPSQLHLGQILKDPKKSISWFTKAAEQGLPEAELGLSSWYLKGTKGLLRDEVQAYAWAHRAALKGLDEAEFTMGYFHEQGIGTNVDIVESRIWYQRAAGQGFRPAMQRLQELETKQKCLIS